MFPKGQKNNEIDNSQMRSECYSRYKSDPIYQIGAYMVKSKIQALLGISISRIPDLFCLLLEEAHCGQAASHCAFGDLRLGASPRQASAKGAQHCT